MTRPDPTGETLWDLLALNAGLRSTWETSRSEADRLGMRASWEIHITCPGYREPLPPGQPCSATVLSRDTADEENHLDYRGACLGCGWLAESSHPLHHGGENAAAEDALDHTHPGWRYLPVVGPLPHNDGGATYQRAIVAWRHKWEPLLPPGWLDTAGPVRTPRTGHGTRHVPGRAPGGGYDTAAPSGETEAPGGQIALFA